MKVYINVTTTSVLISTILCLINIVLSTTTTSSSSTLVLPIIDELNNEDENNLIIVNTSVSKHRHYDVYESTYKIRPSFHFHSHELPSSRIDFYRYNVLFNKPMYINLTIPLHSKDVQPYLNGIVRLRCGGKIFNSYITTSENENFDDMDEEIMNQNSHIYLKPIFDQTADGHMFSTLLLMNRNRWNTIKGLEYLKPKDCTIHFLHKYERSIDNYHILTSIDGEEVTTEPIIFNQNHHKIEENHLIINDNDNDNNTNTTDNNNTNKNHNRLKYIVDKDHFYNKKMITIGNSSGDKHKDAVMRLSPIKFMKLMHIYTHFVDVLLNDTSYVRVAMDVMNDTDYSSNTTTTTTPHRKRRRKLLSKDLNSDQHNALMKAVETLRMKTLLKLGLHAGELYEIVIKPIATALGKQLPEVLFELVKFPLTVLLRDLTTGGMKGALTEPVLNQLDPRSLFGAGSEETPTASTGGHKGEHHAAGLADDIGYQVTDTVINSLSKALWHRIEMQLPQAIAIQCARSVSQGVIMTVTYTLTHSISRALIEILSTTLTKAIARNVNSALIPSLTYSLVPVITHSLMHSPRADYYCFYCVESNIYCEYCRKSHAYDYKQDYYISYYTGYYTQYYSHAYSTGLSDGAAEEYFSKTGQQPRI